MSLIQSIIGSAVGAATPPVTYPAPGSNYPAGSYTTNQTVAVTPTGYYPWPTFISTNPTNGLWRKTYTGMALDGNNCDLNFPTGYTQVESMLDPAVGFGSATDSATNYTMEWLGYYAPEVDGNFTFAVNSVDDYIMMWIGAEAVSGFNNSNWLLKANGAQASSSYVPMLSGRWYPVRIRYTEGSGGNSCPIVHGLNGQPMKNNNESGPIVNGSPTGLAGYFKTDSNTNAGTFPSGLLS